MKRIECMVVYDFTHNGCTIKNITVKNRQSIVQLNRSSIVLRRWADAYAYVLKLLTANGYSVDHWSEFGTDWFDVCWMNGTTCAIDYFPHKCGGDGA